MSAVLQVAIAVPLAQGFDYLPPLGIDAATILPGTRIKVPFAGVQHNALADAHHQAVWACEIHKQLFGKTAVKGKVKA